LLYDFQLKIFLTAFTGINQCAAHGQMGWPAPQNKRRGQLSRGVYYFIY
jgi:hypothetical protein